MKLHPEEKRYDGPLPNVGCAVLAIIIAVAFIFGAAQLFAQTTTIKYIADTALLVTKLPSCSSACPDSVRLTWNINSRRYPEVLKPKLTDTIKILRVVGTDLIAYREYSTISKINTSAPFTIPALPAPPIIVPPPGTTTVELPRVYLDTMIVNARLAPINRTIPVQSSNALQSAIDTSKYGDVILLSSNVTYTGQFHLRCKTGLGWITIRGDGVTPNAGVRARPSTSIGWPKIVSDLAAGAAIQTDLCAQGYRFVGIEITVQPQFTNGYGMILFGDAGTAQTTGKLAQRLILDRVYIHGIPTYHFQRCVALNSGASVIIDSWISECHGKGYDSQAIAGWNGPGPYLVENNYLEGSGENIMFGGAGPRIAGQIPSDIVIRRNHIAKNPAWEIPKTYTIKNLGELKLGIRVLWEANVFENNWDDAQTGSAIVMNSTNDENNAPWSETRDITFRWNLVRNSPAGINLAAAPNAASGSVIPMSKVYIGNNSFENLFGQVSSHRWMSIEAINNLTVENNTGFNPRHGIILTGQKGSNWTIINNAFGTTQANYDSFGGVDGDGGTIGTAALNTFSTSWIFTGNVMPSGLTSAQRSAHPVGNFFTAPADLQGKGVDKTTLNSMIAGVIVPP